MILYQKWNVMFVSNIPDGPVISIIIRSGRSHPSSDHMYCLRPN